MLAQRGRIARAPRRRSLLTLSRAERENVSRGIASGWSNRWEIANSDTETWVPLMIIECRQTPSKKIGQKNIPGAELAPGVMFNSNPRI
jgi:hypothetical protein